MAKKTETAGPKTIPSVGPGNKKNPFKELKKTKKPKKRPAKKKPEKITTTYFDFLMQK